MKISHNFEDFDIIFKFKLILLETKISRQHCLYERVRAVRNRSVTKSKTIKINFLKVQKCEDLSGKSSVKHSQLWISKTRIISKVSFSIKYAKFARFWHVHMSNCPWEMNFLGLPLSWRKFCLKKFKVPRNV